MSSIRPAVIVLALFAALGCAKPNAANIALRKQVQTQQDRIDQLTRQHTADAASLNAQNAGPATAPVLSSEQTAAVYTTHGIRLGKLTGPSDFDPSTAGVDGLAVHVIPTDDTGDDFKAAGAITVEAYDLTDAGRRVGRWAFSAEQARALWNGTGLRYEYVLDCPWQEKPAGRPLTLKVTFVDTLTGRSFDAQQVVDVRPE